MSHRSRSPEVHAGSMADIAFLLLIFFLVTTTIETDAGLDRMLPRIDEKTPPVPYHEKNILKVSLNGQGELLVDDKLTAMEDIKALAIAFIDNGGAPATDTAFCAYCRGEKAVTSSDNPKKAVIAVDHSRETNYGVYITLQNELVSAYTHLRNREAQRLYKRNFTDLQAQYLSPETSEIVKASLRVKVKHIQAMYPLNLSEAATL